MTYSRQTQTQGLAQRWVREDALTRPPGSLKDQLPTKHLKVAARGDLVGVKRLLADNPEFLNRAANHGRTLLWEATRFGRLSLVKYLVSKGAALDQTGCYNSETHVQITPSCVAWYYGHGAVDDYLRSHHLELDVFRAAFMGDRKCVDAHLMRRPELISAEDPCDRVYTMPLVAFPLAGGHEDLVMHLVARGAPVAQYSSLLIFLAGLTDQLTTLELLLANGVDAEQTTSATFVSSENLEILRFLCHRGAPVNTVSGGFPPLAYVCRADKSRRVDKVQLLLQCGADVNGRGRGGRTALHHAAGAGAIETIRILLAHGASRDLKDETGQTPLDAALAANKTSAAELLR